MAAMWARTLTPEALGWMLRDLEWAAVAARAISLDFKPARHRVIVTRCAEVS